MHYTTQLPTENGFYFVKVEGQLSGKLYETVVKVYSTEINDTKPNAVFWDGENFNLTDSCFKSFAGPIETPTDYTHVNDIKPEIEIEGTKTDVSRALEMEEKIQEKMDTYKNEPLVNETMIRMQHEIQGIMKTYQETYNIDPIAYWIDINGERMMVVGIRNGIEHKFIGSIYGMGVYIQSTEEGLQVVTSKGHIITKDRTQNNEFVLGSESYDKPFIFESDEEAIEAFKTFTHSNPIG